MSDWKKEKCGDCEFWYGGVLIWTNTMTKDVYMLNPCIRFPVWIEKEKDTQACGEFKDNQGYLNPKEAVHRGS